MYKVLIIQAEMKHYRIPFFTGLYDALRQDGIELTVAYSNSNAIHASRSDRDELPAPAGLRVPGTWFFRRFLYQPLWRRILGADLVIVGPEVKYLNNIPLLILSRLGLKTVAFWGLGPNRHPDHSPLAEWFKQFFYTYVDWWFAYTPSIVDYLKGRGMPAGKITNVQNATDTNELRRLIAAIPASEVLDARIALTGSAEAPIGLYCGLIGPIKSIPLLLESARLLKRESPDFHLVIIGDGPERPWLQSQIADEPWIHVVGFKNHEGSAIYYKMASFFVLAGTVGLAVVDSFAAGLPLIATRLDSHPPEISYIINGYNGMLVNHDAHSLAAAMHSALTDEEVRSTLRAGAQQSGAKYTMEAMVENYRQGIRRCLAQYKAKPATGTTESLTTSAER